MVIGIFIWTLMGIIGWCNIENATIDRFDISSYFFLPIGIIAGPLTFFLSFMMFGNNIFE
jgi:hypothetical protein